MRRFAPLAFVVLTACGSGGGGDGLDLSLFTPTEPPVRTNPDAPVGTFQTESGHFAVMNGNLPTILAVEVFAGDSVPFDEYEVSIPEGEVWEADEAEDIPPGTYYVRVHFAGGSAGRFFTRTNDVDGLVFVWAHLEFGF